MYHPLGSFDGERGQWVRVGLPPGQCAGGARGEGGPTPGYSSPQAALSARADCRARRFRLCRPRGLRRLEEVNRELGGLAYVVGLAQKAVLLRFGAAALSEAHRRCQAPQQTGQQFDAFAYAAESWPQTRHVVMKADVREHGPNPRFVVTSLSEFAPALLYQAYCERGQCENFITDCKKALRPIASLFHVCGQLLSRARTRSRLRAPPCPAHPGGAAGAAAGAGAVRYAALAALERSRDCFAVHASAAPPAPSRISVRAAVPPTGHEARGAAGLVLRVRAASSQPVFSLAPSSWRRQGRVRLPLASSRQFSYSGLRFSPLFLL